MKHVVIGQRQKVFDFSAFHWPPHGSLLSIGQHFVTTRIVHLPKWTETSFITESNQTVQAVHSCNGVCLVYNVIQNFVVNFAYLSLTQNDLIVDKC